MNQHVWNQPARKRPVRQTPELRRAVLDLIAQSQSQNQVARALGISQTLVWRIVRDAKGEQNAAHA